jgi:predicted nuclease with RNAse H fold
VGTGIAKVIAGIDLASLDERTATCRITWRDGRVIADDPVLGASDPELRELIEVSDKVGIDIPLGWPSLFVTAISAHHSRLPWPETGARERRLRFRVTDFVVREETGHWPLSVSSDLIGVPALRAARLLSEMDVDRSGEGKLVEVYPAAALRRWRLPPTGYKRSAGARARHELVNQFAIITTAWLDLSSEGWEACKGSDDAFDALLAALVALAKVNGLCDPVTAEHQAVARVEGWIALPHRDSLSYLPRQPPLP